MGRGLVPSSPSSMSFITLLSLSLPSRAITTSPHDRKTEDIEVDAIQVKWTLLWERRKSGTQIDF